MHLEAVDTVGVVGAGTMGNGIAQVAATAGYDVVMRDVSEELVAAGFEDIQASFETLVARETVTAQEAEAATARITGTTELDDLAAADLVVEAVTEDMEIKQSVFEELDAVCGSNAVLASNTSTLSITTIASVTERPEQVLGLHFMNPVPVMKGVELVVGERTSDETVTLGREFAHDIGKETWEADDKPGFVVNRVLMPWINEGIRAYDEGVADKADIDRGLTLGTNVPMGPLELADHIGLDVVLDASETLYEELGDRYKPAYLLKRKVAAGDLGKKSGRGFYDYD
jgi:3-hydroxybutyryl-CoA dehydrogenase